MPKVIVTPRARRQLAAASEWWLSHRDKAPEAFAEDVAAAFDTLTQHPLIGERSGPNDVRRVFLQRTRYFIDDRVVAAGDVHVLAVWHASRGSRPQF